MNNVKYNLNVEELRMKSCILYIIYVYFLSKAGANTSLKHYRKKGTFLASTLKFNALNITKMIRKIVLNPTRMIVNYLINLSRCTETNAVSIESEHTKNCNFNNINVIKKMVLY